MRKRKFQKNSKKNRKTKQYHYGFISSQNRLEKAEKEKKCKLSIRSVPTRCVIQNSKKIEKKFKKLNNSSQNKLEKAAKEKKCKFSFRSVPFLQDA